MFEDRTAENILREMLDSVTADIDKRQGSIIYDALAPQSFAIAKQYLDLKWMSENIVSLLTASGDYLDVKGNDFGVTRDLAVFAERNATFVGTTIANGERFFTNDGLYWAYNSNKNRVICEQSGLIGNSTITGNTLIPVSTIPNLASASIGSVVIPGKEIEDDESYRNRIIMKLRHPEINSNKSQIKKWCKDVTGVGDVRIFPTWNGVNTVKAVIIDTDKQPASQEIINQVQSYIEPYDLTKLDENRGLGEGVADIGVIFTAVSATSTPINVNFRVTTLANNKTIEDVKTEVTENLKKYLQSIAFLQEKVKDIVRYQEISAMILNTDSVIDFNNLTINTGNANVEIELDHIATVGTITVTQ